MRAVAALVTRSGRSATLGTQVGRGRRGGAQEGRTLGAAQREELGARIWTVGRSQGGMEWRGLLLPPSLLQGARMPSVRARRGDAGGPLPKGPDWPGGGSGRGRRGSPGNPLGFPAAFPGPHRGLASGRGGRAGEGHSKFPATFPGCGKRAAERRSQDRGQE